jgi:RHS repeat-associated protein
MDMTYTYSGTNNNGQITQSVDAMTGETIVYQYDALKRLASANGLNWGETYTYDGFGNLTQMSPSGTAGAPTLSVTVDATTNRITPGLQVSYDNNGNMTQGGYLAYDVANRMKSAIVEGGTIYYGYDSANLRIYYRNTSNAETIYLYGADGKKPGIYTVSSVTNTSIQFAQQSTNVYFAGRLLGASVDRLGSVRYGGASGVGYQAQYPYGVEYTPTANDREKYATYTRDSLTGLDYAMNRHYTSLWGRFLSPDPSFKSMDLRNPLSWNRYAYALNDPTNGNDPTGLEEFDEGDGGDDGMGGGGGGGGGGASGGDGGGNFTSGSITGTQTSGFGVLTDSNGNPIPLPVVGDPNQINANNAVTVGTTGGPSQPTRTSSLPAISMTLTGGVPFNPTNPLTWVLSMLGAGGTLTIIPQQGTVYLGPTFSLSTPGNNMGGSITVWTNVPSGTDPSNILGGSGSSITIQPAPLAGYAGSPGVGYVIGGWTAGTKTPGSYQAGYGFCLYGPCF